MDKNKEEILKKAREDWIGLYRKKLRARIVGIANKDIMDPLTVMAGMSLNCDTKSTIIECLREIADDLEKNTILMK